MKHRQFRNSKGTLFESLCPLKSLSLFIFGFLIILVIVQPAYAKGSLAIENYPKRQLLQSDSSSSSRDFCVLQKGPNGQLMCTWPLYVRVLFGFATGGIILAILSCVAFPVFTLGRYCCQWFGGSERSSGWFCSRDKTKFVGYSKWQIRGLQITLIVLAGIFIIAFGVGLDGNVKINRGINNLLNTAIGSVTELFNKLQDVIQTIESLPSFQTIGLGNSTYSTLNPLTSNFTGTLLQFQQTGNSILTSANLIKNMADQINEGRYAFIILSFLIPVILYGIGAVFGMVFRMTKFMLYTGLLFFFASFIIWMSLGIHGVITIVAEDGCTQWNSFLQTEASQYQNNVGVSIFLDCLEGRPSNLYYELTNYLNLAYNESCNVTNAICGMSQYICHSTETCTKDNFLSILSQMTIIDLVCQKNSLNTSCVFVNRTISNCSVDCSNQELKNISIYLNTTLLWIKTFQNILNSDVLPLINCSFVDDMVQKIEDSFCSDVTTGFDEITAGSGLMGISLVFGTFGFIMGYKRFMKDKSKVLQFNYEKHKEPEEHEMEKKEEITKE